VCFGKNSLKQGVLHMSVRVSRQTVRCKRRTLSVRVISTACRSLCYWIELTGQGLARSQNPQDAELSRKKAIQKASSIGEC
jgi:hypothetical protein